MPLRGEKGGCGMDFPDFDSDRYAELLKRLYQRGGDHEVYAIQADVVSHALFKLKGQIRVSSEELAQATTALAIRMKEAGDSASASAQSMLWWTRALVFVTAAYTLATIAQLLAR